MGQKEIGRNMNDTQFEYKCVYLYLVILNQQQTFSKSYVNHTKNVNSTSIFLTILC